MKKKNMMKVLLVKPETHPQVVEIENELKVLQKIIGGLIQSVYPFEDEVCLICNDEGKLLNLQMNRALSCPLSDDDGGIYDVIAGNFLVVGAGIDNFCSLTDEQIERYEKRFHQPEMFLRIGQQIVVFPMSDEEVK